MSKIEQIRTQLDTANARVASLEKALQEHPGYPSIAANLDTALRIREKLQSQLNEVAATIGGELVKLHTPASPRS